MIVVHRLPVFLNLVSDLGFQLFMLAGIIITIVHIIISSICILSQLLFNTYYGQFQGVSRRITSSKKFVNWSFLGFYQFIFELPFNVLFLPDTHFLDDTNRNS